MQDQYLRPGSILYLFDPYCSNVQSEEYNLQICDLKPENRPVGEYSMWTW